MPTSQAHRTINLVRRFIHPPLSIEDVVQDIEIECWKKNKKPSYQLIRSRCYDALRKSQREKSLLEKSTQIKLNGAIQPLEFKANDTNLLEHLYKLSGLSLSLRVLLYKRFFQSKTFKQIAKEESKTKSQVSEEVSSALAQLRKASNRHGN